MEASYDKIIEKNLYELKCKSKGYFVVHYPGQLIR